MVQHIKEILSTVANMAKENIHGLIKKLIIKANGNMISFREKDSCIFQIIADTMVISRIICFMEMEFIFGRMDQNIQANFIVIKNMEKELINE